MSVLKISRGNFFEDFRVGQVLEHATPKTITVGDVALYNGLYGSRFALQSSDAFARSLGFPRAPVDDLLVFHTVFGKTVPDISLNAVANLGYADCRFLVPVYPGDTLRATSEVIGLRENSSGKTGVVYVRSRGMNQDGELVIDYIRWVMVKKHDLSRSAPVAVMPELSDRIPPDHLANQLPPVDVSRYCTILSGSPYRFGDYAVGEQFDHMDAMTLEEAEHQIATRVYQNTARVHFNQYEQAESRFGARLIYGGVIISLARALSFNGLGNAFKIAGLNGGRHVAPTFAGDTIFAWTEVLETSVLQHRHDLGALRLRTIATRNRPCDDFPDRTDGSSYDEGVVLDLDYWVLVPR
ncbi:MAG: MaoC family dehydratase [Hyphomicrobiaceae bacterium]